MCFMIDVCIVAFNVDENKHNNIIIIIIMKSSIIFITSKNKFENTQDRKTETNNERRNNIAIPNGGQNSLIY